MPVFIDEVIFRIIPNGAGIEGDRATLLALQKCDKLERIHLQKSSTMIKLFCILFALLNYGEIVTFHFFIPVPTYTKTFLFIFIGIKSVFYNL
jgi:hypothetical protein